MTISSSTYLSWGFFCCWKFSFKPLNANHSNKTSCDKKNPHYRQLFSSVTNDLNESVTFAKTAVIINKMSNVLTFCGCKGLMHTYVQFKMSENIFLP